MTDSNISHPRLEVESLVKSFTLDGQRFPVLEDVSLSVREGEFISVIGPSGCGKTTLLNCIAGLDEPNSGTVKLDGYTQVRLGKVGFMPQKDVLLPWRTVLDNVILGLEIMGCSHKLACNKALALIQMFGLGGSERRFPATLSGGMKQRAALLRTVLADQDPILLDEPFGALDALTRGRLQEWMLEVWDSLGKTIVLITHDVEEAILLSDRVYVLSTRPARVKLIVDVDLPRPRSYKMVTGDSLVNLKGLLLDSLEQDY